MASVLIISSYVAASRVGGGIAPFVLTPLGLDSFLAPTTLLGRHPGHGPPGGGPVPADMLAGVLEGIEAQGLFSEVSAVVTGYFAGPEQVEVAAAAIDRIKAAPRKLDRPWKPSRAPLTIVDPIMGDSDKGLYVSEDTAMAINELLAPRADLVTPNIWELSYMLGHPDTPPANAAEVQNAARGLRCASLISSVPIPDGIGALHTDPASGEIWLATSPLLRGAVPKGAGDLLTLLFAGGLVKGRTSRANLENAVAATTAILERAVAGRMDNLPLTACWDLLRNMPEIAVERLE